MKTILAKGILEVNKRFFHIDMLEALAIFFVVFYHNTTYKYNFLDMTNPFGISYIYYIRYFVRTIISTCVPLFFFCNGYLLFSKTYSLSKHINRVIRLVLLTFTGLILCPIYMIISGVPLETKVILLNWLNMDKEWSMNRYWFIGALVCIYIFFPALKSLYNHDENSFNILTATMFLLTFGVRFINVSLAIANTYIEVIPSNINYKMIDMFIPIRKYGFSFVYFCLGGITFKLESTILQISKAKRNIGAIITTIAACIGLFIVGIYNSKNITHTPWDVVWEGYDTILTLLNVISLYILSLNVTSENKLITHISSSTLWIYLFHGLIIRATQPTFKHFPMYSTITFSAFYAAFVVIVCMMMRNLLRKIYLHCN